jgi:hypothetical protein
MLRFIGWHMYTLAQYFVEHVFYIVFFLEHTGGLYHYINRRRKKKQSRGTTHTHIKQSTTILLQKNTRPQN